jgi:hypothetical protein
MHPPYIPTGMRLLAIPHANVLGLILFFKKKDFVWEIIKISHPTPKCHVRNGSHFGCIGENTKRPSWILLAGTRAPGGA